MKHLAALDDIITSTLTQLALRTDTEARFPREVIDALGRANVMTKPVRPASRDPDFRVG